LIIFLKIYLFIISSHSIQSLGNKR
uniref:Predicted gene, 17387 n=1 Tax=Mus spicilegus TaxID=10103 RepID=A0A8C6H821_MUSSI